MKKAAVVIGVAKTGQLPELESAQTGAKEIAKWLEDEGFDVECITDESSPVQTNHITEALRKFVTQPATYHLLLLFFTGHGYWYARSDRWLLSDAHRQSSEAINLEGAIDLARYSGIPTVVFVSDACRTLPKDWAGSIVEGIDGFPTVDFTTPSKVDWFKAASPALPAYELPIDNGVESVFTYAFRAAYREPDSSMISEITESGQTVQVVPNRKLEEFLQNKVDEILTTHDINLSQTLEVNVPSSDDVYIATVSPHHVGQPHTPSGAASQSVGHEAAEAIRGILSRNDFMDPAAMIPEPPMSAPVEAAVRMRQPSDFIDHCETQCGIAVTGASVADVFVSEQVNNLKVERKNKSEDAFRVYDAYPAATVFVLLRDGRVIPLAVIDGYIAHVACGGKGVKSISYVPSSNHYRFAVYAPRKSKVDRLRSLVAVAADRNSFHLKSNREASSLAGRIRMEKATDPSLGVYAAHAYSQAGDDERVVSILRHMRDDISADLFDVRLLANRRLEEHELNYPYFPACPMLTQSWNLLRPRNMLVHPTIRESADYLCNSLWTTFDTPIANRLLDSLRNGEFDENPIHPR